MLYLSVCIHQFTHIYPHKAAASGLNASSASFSRTFEEVKSVDQWRWRSPVEVKVTYCHRIHLGANCMFNTDLFSEWNSEVSGFGWIYVVSWCVNLHLVDWNSVECLVWIELHWSMWQVKSHRLTLCVTFIHSSSHLTPTHITVLRSDYPLTMTDY